VSVLLERDHELSAIGVALAKARDGHGGCILLEGPAGIGKTALLAATRSLAQDHGARVLAASGGELEIEFPFGAVRQLFGGLTAEEGAAELFAGPAALAHPVLELEEGTPQSGKGLLESLHGLFSLTANLATTSPLLLAIDDAHWCDGASLRFVLYLRRRLERLPVTLVVASRTGEPGADPRLISQFTDTAGVEIIRPLGLSRHGVETLVAGGLQEQPDPAFTDAAFAATAGNPFLVRELVAALRQQQVRPTERAAALVPPIGPEGVRRSMLQRLSALGPGAGALARAVAVLGGGVALHQAADLAGLADGEAITIAETLVRVQILRDERLLSFLHPLVRATVYADMPAAARAQAHARAAGLLAQWGADDDTIAAHLLESAPVGDPAVVERLRTAAHRAGAHGATDVAATYLRRAVEEPPEPAQRGAVLRELGAAELAAGDPNGAAARLATAQELADDAAARISIVLMRRHALVLADRIAEAVAVVDELGTGEGGDHRDLLAAAALGAAHLDFAISPRFDDRLRRLRDRAADPTCTEPLALAVAATETGFANRPASTARALVERAVRALATAHPASDYSVEGQLGLALWLAEHYDRLDELAHAWFTDARSHGSLPRYISMATLRSLTSYRRGRLADAEAQAHDALEATRLYGHQFWLPGAVAALIDPLVEYGRFDDAERVLVETRVQELHGHSSAFCWAAFFLPARGRLRAAQARHREALADFTACAELESPGNRAPSLWAWRSGAALTLEALGEHDRAVDVADDEVALTRPAGPTRALGVALRASGVVQARDGLSRLDEAAECLARTPARLEQARALVDLGAARRRSGQRTEARPPLRQGLDLATACGAGPLVERANQELLASGALPRRQRMTGPESLTPSERRVAQLAAAGRSNPDIAQALFLTRRTVETHLTHVYQKLAITSRESLATALEEPTP
jgi:ATP/maltotriose-dependent transcriptional regulator MalT